MLALKRPRDSPSQQPEPMCSPARMLLSDSPASTHKRTRIHGEASAGSSSSAFLADLSSVTDGGTCDAADVRPPLRQRIDPVTGEVLLPMDQVRDIVRRAVEEKERTLREQYDRILQAKLQEQYQAFAKFNEDYISRSLKSSDLGYVS